MCFSNSEQLTIISSMSRKKIKNHTIARFAQNNQLQTHETVYENLYQQGVSKLVECRKQLELSPDTLFLAVSIFKKSLLEETKRTKLKSLYLASIWISAKFNEITPPILEQLCFLEDFFITAQDIIQMEERILEILNFDLFFEDNIYGKLIEFQQSMNHQNQALQFIYQTLSNPIFSKVSSFNIAKTFLIFQYPHHSQQQNISPQTRKLIQELKNCKQKVRQFPSLKNLNISDL